MTDAHPPMPPGRDAHGHPCQCDCHIIPGMMHVVACCHYELDPELLKLSELPKDEK